MTSKMGTSSTPDDDRILRKRYSAKIRQRRCRERKKEAAAALIAKAAAEGKTMDMKTALKEISKKRAIRMKIIDAEEEARFGPVGRIPGNSYLAALASPRMQSSYRPRYGAYPSASAPSSSSNMNHYQVLGSPPPMMRGSYQQPPQYHPHLTSVPPPLPPMAGAGQFYPAPRSSHYPFSYQTAGSMHQPHYLTHHQHFMGSRSYSSASQNSSNMNSAAVPRAVSRAGSEVSFERSSGQSLVSHGLSSDSYPEVSFSISGDSASLCPAPSMETVEKSSVAADAKKDDDGKKKKKRKDKKKKKKSLDNSEMTAVDAILALQKSSSEDDSSSSSTNDELSTDPSLLSDVHTAPSEFDQPSQIVLTKPTCYV